MYQQLWLAVGVFVFVSVCAVVGAVFQRASHTDEEAVALTQQIAEKRLLRAAKREFALLDEVKRISKHLKSKERSLLTQRGKIEQMDAAVRRARQRKAQQQVQQGEIPEPTGSGPQVVLRPAAVSDSEDSSEGEVGELDIENKYREFLAWKREQQRKNSGATSSLRRRRTPSSTASHQRQPLSRGPAGQDNSSSSSSGSSGGSSGSSSSSSTDTTSDSDSEGPAVAAKRQHSLGGVFDRRPRSLKRRLPAPRTGRGGPKIQAAARASLAPTPADATPLDDGGGDVRGGPLPLPLPAPHSSDPLQARSPV